MLAEGMILKNQLNAVDDIALIRQASEGCLDAFNQLVLRYQNLAYHHAYAILADAASAEDITQDSFIKAFKNIHKFRGDSFRAWLLRIVTNTAYDLLRQIKRCPTRSLYLKDDYGEEYESRNWLTDPSPSVEATVERNEDSRFLYQVLAELPEVYRSALILVDLYELDYSEVSKILQVPLGTVKSRVARARMQMKRKLQDGPVKTVLGFHTEWDPGF